MKLLANLFKRKQEEQTIIVDDEKEIAFITQCTGIDKETIQQVMNSHYDYLESLGLIK